MHSVSHLDNSAKSKSPDHSRCVRSSDRRTHLAEYPPRKLSGRSRRPTDARRGGDDKQSTPAAILDRAFDMLATLFDRESRTDAGRDFANSVKAFVPACHGWHQLRLLAPFKIEMS
jgi:hypothetical protein